MKLTSNNFYLSSVIGLSAILLVMTGLTVIWQLPKLNQVRVDIDNERASLELLNQQRSNVAKLTQDITTIQTEQTALETNLWSFLKEDDFFNFFSSLSDNHSIITDELNLSDAAPAKTIVTRTFSVILTGRPANIISTINDLQRHTPLLIIKNIAINPSADDSNNVPCTIEGVTLWLPQ